MKVSFKVVLLTTDSAHHTYYAWKLNENFRLQGIILETRSMAPPFATFHSFETLRDDYERAVLLANFDSTFKDLADTRSFESINNAESVALLRALSPDVVLVFGTGKLAEPVIRIASLACLNLHGGNPEQYRGLDTHLWAIYHRDFANLVTTLHHVDSGLDTGDIVFQTQINLTRESKLYELRALNTRACVDLSLLALESLESLRMLPSRKQARRGRYYSHMPSVLKEDCKGKFEQYVAGL